jgi:hypothetical protein
MYPYTVGDFIFSNFFLLAVGGWEQESQGWGGGFRNGKKKYELGL